MAKQTSHFVCQTCGAATTRWLGRCPDCGSWNSFVEEVTEKASSFSLVKHKATPSIVLTELTTESAQRYKTGNAEVDRLLGGGIVVGSVILLGGNPGIGKSTLLLELANKVQTPVLYVSAEESLQQIKLRADRLGITNNQISLLAETSLESILSTVATEKPSLLVIDSIQTITSEQLTSAAGSVGQVRECAAQITAFAKQHDVSVILVGHITKDGMLAGPKTLEHLVDVVLSLEGEPETDVRLLRSTKNRFGTTFELGIFHMTDQGMEIVSDPTTVFLQHTTKPVSGSCIGCVIEGTRPLLIEVQALTSRTVFGLPRRTTSGVDLGRLHLLSAVLSKQCKVDLSGQDIYLNVTGGLSLREPAIDVGICVSLLSSTLQKPAPVKSVFFGEVGLLGEIRPVNRSSERILEIGSRGFTTVYAPKQSKVKLPKGLSLVELTHISQLEEILA
jgi:DNA repair protein RadA/Sms